MSGYILDNGAGPGKYSFELARNGYNVTLSDITPRLIDIAKEKPNELGLTDKFRGFHVLNATYLDGISSNSFDASLMMGCYIIFRRKTIEKLRLKSYTELSSITVPFSWPSKVE
ncbi:class I SAM-dependent methyltransferase [Brevibacillus halotolerans]|nr:class I SAM-dependent methyltransferase [Brevibacillus halotolerans]